MSKKKKVRIYFTLDEDLSNEFKEYVESKVLNQSKQLELLVREFMMKIRKED